MRPIDWLREMETHCTPLDHKGRPERGGGTLDYHLDARSRCDRGEDPETAAAALVAAELATPFRGHCGRVLKFWRVRPWVRHE